MSLLGSELCKDIASLRCVFWNSRGSLGAFTVCRVRLEVKLRRLRGLDRDHEATFVRVAHGSRHELECLGEPLPLMCWYGTVSDGASAGGCIAGVKRGCEWGAGGLEHEHIVCGWVHCPRLGVADVGTCLAIVLLVPSLWPRQFVDESVSLMRASRALGGSHCFDGEDYVRTCLLARQLEEVMGAGMGRTTCVVVAVSVSRSDPFIDDAVAVEIVGWPHVAERYGAAAGRCGGCDHLPCTLR